MLLNLLLWPLMKMDRCVCLMGCEAGVWDHQRWGENGRWGWRSDGATGNRLHLYRGRQDLLLCNKSATRKKIRCENPNPDPPPLWALGSPSAAGTRLEQGLSNHGEPGESRPQTSPSPSHMDWNCRKLRVLRLFSSSMTRLDILSFVKARNQFKKLFVQSISVIIKFFVNKKYSHYFLS